MIVFFKESKYSSLLELVEILPWALIVSICALIASAISIHFSVKQSHNQIEIQKSENRTERLLSLHSNLSAYLNAITYDPLLIRRNFYAAKRQDIVLFSFRVVEIHSHLEYPLVYDAFRGEVLIREDSEADTCVDSAIAQNVYRIHECAKELTSLSKSLNFKYSKPRKAKAARLYAEILERRTELEDANNAVNMQLKEEKILLS